MRLQRAGCGQRTEAAGQPGTMQPAAGRLPLTTTLTITITICICMASPGLGQENGTADWNSTEGYGSASGSSTGTSSSSTDAQLLPTATASTTANATAVIPTTASAAPNTGSTAEPVQALRCNCSVVGSVNETTCNASSGQCECLAGYSGLRCGDCAEEFYHDGTSGLCTACECHDLGATSAQCTSTGRCSCKPGVTGLKCSSCQVLHYELSETGCRPCQCNGLALACDQQTGFCWNCTGNTKGHHCENCTETFYRKPQVGLTAECERCPCSVVTSSGSCHLVLGEAVCDGCLLGYFGTHCDECADGYHNSDSICVRCHCSGNSDPQSKLPICDSESGRCLSCSANTTGFNCDQCAEGYRGDAAAHNCSLELTTVLPTSSTETGSSTSPPVTAVTNSSEQPVQLTAQSTVQSRESTAAPAAPEISWTRFNIVVLVVIIAVVVLLMGFVAGVYVYREYRNRKLNAPFWTIELKEDNISFSSYHDSIPNADVSGLLEDDGNEVVPNGQLTLSAPITSSYKI
ncbi:multiple epidermal growth factor-like domains protein 9 [Leucoraja erinacea]|uniref:multiple epidermal growth factor-like domains protein 9 n=1 Tax=Leucoraja erinaceus TaxID=7782 RepID=UPI002457D793|nr:multiple epidermal growth factor-like domains protein 9 [Leucoraja erinacea]